MWKSAKSLALYHTLCARGFPEPFALEISELLCTDFTAGRLLGYLRYFEHPSPEELGDEIAAILEERDKYVEKKKTENANMHINCYINREDGGDDGEQ